jgi:hypothetical protein
MKKLRACATCVSPIRKTRNRVSVLAKLLRKYQPNREFRANYRVCRQPTQQRENKRKVKWNRCRETNVQPHILPRRSTIIGQRKHLDFGVCVAVHWNPG